MGSTGGELLVACLKQHAVKKIFCVPGESYLGAMDALFDHLAEADVFAAIGTSGNVYPAAGFVAEARRAGAHTIEFNLERSAVGNQFAEHRIGPASHTVPEWVAEVLAARR